MSFAASLGGTVAASVALLAVSWCAPQAASEPPETEPKEGSPAVEPLPEAQRGAPIEINLPLYGEGAVALSTLRGKLVVVDLFAPAQPGWSEAHTQWRDLVRAHPGDVAFVAVAVAGTDPSAVDAWDAQPPTHLVAWDPQGALALRLGVEALPTVVLLDRQGRMVATGTDRAAMHRTVASTLAR